MQVQLLLNIFQTDLIIGRGKLKFNEVALLTSHLKNNMTKTCKVINSMLALVNCIYIVTFLPWRDCHSKHGETVRRQTCLDNTRSEHPGEASQ